NLPKGWEVKISRPDHADSVGNKALFHMQFVYPSVEWPDPMEHRLVMQHPSLTLAFHKPFSKEEIVQFEKKSKELHNSDQAVGYPNIFVKTENYWILTYESGVSFRHEKEKELYQHLKKYLSVNRKE
ncbi:MAG: hypothetical protein ACQ9IQ_15720, partial [Nitrospirales bacterium]